MLADPALLTFVAVEFKEEWLKRELARDVADRGRFAPADLGLTTLADTAVFLCCTSRCFTKSSRCSCLCPPTLDAEDTSYCLLRSSCNASFTGSFVLDSRTNVDFHVSRLPALLPGRALPGLALLALAGRVLELALLLSRELAELTGRELRIALEVWSTFPLSEAERGRRDTVEVPRRLT